VVLARWLRYDVIVLDEVGYVPLADIVSYRLRQLLIHTGQHYDANMSHVSFRQFEMPNPDANLPSIPEATRSRLPK
jgi:hypothetical protein